MRAVNFVENIEFDFQGPVVRNGLALGDVDNDGNDELVVGNENGDVSIFKVKLIVFCFIRILQCCFTADGLFVFEELKTKPVYFHFRVLIFGKRSMV